MLETILTFLSGATGGVIISEVIQSLRDKRKQHYERRLHILRQLLSNACNVTGLEFLSGLNMILIEYNKQNSPIKKLHEEFCRSLSKISNNGEDSEYFLKERREILTKLIEEVAKSINIKIEQFDIMTRIYPPFDEKLRYDLSNSSMRFYEEAEKFFRRRNASEEINTPKTK